MSDSPIEEDSLSSSKLIQVQHVGVTARIRSPLCGLFPGSNFTSDSEQNTLLFHGQQTTYSKFSNSSHMDTETETSRALYELRTIQPAPLKGISNKGTPSKIEFQLYRRPFKNLRRKQRPNQNNQGRNRSNTTKRGGKRNGGGSFIKRFFCALSVMCSSKGTKNQHSKMTEPYIKAQSANKSKQALLLPFTQNRCTQTISSDMHLGIYHFEHGCGNYLITTDCQPQLASVVLAEKATHFATRFWAEVFGSLHIGVALVIVFFLQLYRFMLFSLVNTLLVGFLQMSSDYFIKPLLSVIFNGFIQPFITFIYQIFASGRDMLAPIADNFNNFMKPVATLGHSLRLVDLGSSSSQRRFEKEV